MSKADFVEAVAKRGNLSKADAKRAIELVFGTVEVGLKAVRNGGKFPIGTFGTFTVSSAAPASAAIREPASPSSSRRRKACGSSLPGSSRTRPAADGCAAARSELGSMNDRLPFSADRLRSRGHLTSREPNVR